MHPLNWLGDLEVTGTGVLCKMGMRQCLLQAALQTSTPVSMTLFKCSYCCVRVIEGDPRSRALKQCLLPEARRREL